MICSYWHYAHLRRRDEKRKLTRTMLCQNADKALKATQNRAVKHYGA